MEVRRNEKNDRLCAERNAMLDGLPIPEEYESEREKWINSEHRVYYKRKGRKVLFSCSREGTSREYITNPVSLEDHIRAYTGRIEHNLYTTCPICGKPAKMVAEGHRRRVDTIKKCFAIYQMPQEDLLTIRIMELEQKFRLAVREEERWPAQQFWETETIRIYLYADHRVYKDFHKSWYGGDFWDYKNLYGMENIAIPIVYDSIGEELAEEAPWLKYIDLNALGTPWKTRIEKQMTATEFPIIELLQKAGASNIVYSLEIASRWPGLNRKAKKPWDFFNVTRERFWQAVHENRGGEFLRECQIERKYNIRLTDDLLRYMENNYTKPDPDIWEYSTPVKYWNYIQKHIGDDIHTEEMAVHFHNDYLQAVKDLGLPLSNSIYMYPRDLMAKHDELIERRDLQRNGIQIEQKNQQYHKIAERYTRLLKKYGYEKAGFVIRPAGSAGEIIEEGKTLHHCVGGDNYLSKHDRGESYILFLRKADAPDKPWCTIEIRDRQIMQWYEAYDQKPDKDIIDPFLREYVKQIPDGRKRVKVG